MYSSTWIAADRGAHGDGERVDHNANLKLTEKHCGVRTAVSSRKVYRLRMHPSVVCGLGTLRRGVRAEGGISVAITRC